MAYFLQQHSIILNIVVPMLLALLCPLLKGRVAWVVAFIAVAISLFFSVFSYFALKNIGFNGEIAYQFGGFVAPYGIEYRIDGLNMLIILLLSFSALVVMFYGFASIGQEISHNKTGLFYCLFLLCYAGLLGIATSNDIFNIYVFLEIASITSYALIAVGKHKKSCFASFEYLIIGTIGATFFLLGVGFLYMITGTLNISDMYDSIKTLVASNFLLPQENVNMENANIFEEGGIASIDAVGSTAGMASIDGIGAEHQYRIFMLKAAFVLILVGLLMKIAVFPLHLWLTNSYAYAPSFVSIFLAGVSAKVSVYLLLRIMFDVFPSDFVWENLPFKQVMLTLGVLGMVIASLTALYQDNMKKLLAFSSIAQIGVILLAIGIGTKASVIAAIFCIIAHAFAKELLFICTGLLNDKLINKKSDNIFFKTALIIGALSLIGVPLTAGFNGKLMAIYSLFEYPSQNIIYKLIAVLIAASSFLTAVYMWNFVNNLLAQVNGNKETSDINRLGEKNEKSGEDEESEEGEENEEGSKGEEGRAEIASEENITISMPILAKIAMVCLMGGIVFFALQPNYIIEVISGYNF